jgi:hypothetical protein
LKEALRLHVIAFRSNAKRASTALARSEVYCRNTAYFLTQQFDRAERPEEMVDFLVNLTTLENIALDPLEEPIGLLVEVIQKHRKTKSEMHRAANKLQALARALSSENSWFDQSARGRVTTICNVAVADLKRRA